MIDPEEGGRVDDESSASTSRSHTGGGDEMSRRLSVAIIPDMRSTNPYQHLLAVALERRGWGVRFPEQFGGRRPLLRGLLSRQFDVLHLDWIHPYAMGPTLARSVTRSAAFVFKLLLARLLGRRIVWTVHNLTSHDSRFERLERFVGRSIATLSHGLVVHFPAAEEIVRASLDVSAAKQIRVAHHGHYIDVYERSGAQRAEVHRDISRPMAVLAFGQVRRYKRLEELIAAVRMLDREDVRLSVRGMARDEVYAADLLHLTEEDDRVDLNLGFIEDDAVAEVFTAADVVALTQTDTLTSGSLILAMSMGKPVVAARTAHSEFLIGDGGGGVLYTPGDPADLAAALQGLLEGRDDLAAMGSRNRRTIAVHTWDRMAEVVEGTYRGNGG